MTSLDLSNGNAAKHQPNELKLWADVQKGDHTSFRVLYMTYTDLLYNYGMKVCRNDELVKDCIQDLFEHLWQNKGKTQITSSLKFYLLTSLRRAIIKKIKKDEKSRDLALNESFELSVESQIIANESDKLRLRALSLAMQKLTKRQREIIFLRFEENLSYEEISSLMSLNQNSAYKLLHAAVKRIRELIVFSLLMMASA